MLVIHVVHVQTGCTHKFEREEAFTSIAVDIRNHHSLEESLEQYVKGDLLEGDNAYKVCVLCLVSYLATLTHTA